MNFISSIVRSGLRDTNSVSEKRGIVLSNQISLILTGLSFTLFITYYQWYGWSFITVALPVIGLSHLIVIVLNSYGLHTISRLWLCFSVPAIAMSVSIYSKNVYWTSQQELDYFSFRFIILSSCVFPFILFSFKEARLMLLSASIALTILMFHDPLHTAFNVGYHQFHENELSSANYEFANVVIIITYFIMVGAVLFLKWISEKAERQNLALIDDLNLANNQLVEKNAEVEAQSIELMAQSEMIHANQKKLIDAYEEIENHKVYLYKENRSLNDELISKNRELIEINEELIKHNNELRQFSYTVSHNLRGPVASLLGLSSLLDEDNLSKNNVTVTQHIKKAAVQLDNVIHDLGKIIDIRNDIFQIRQKVNLADEVEEIKQMLHREIEEHRVTILYDFSNCPFVYSVKPMVHSILYNLISNSIKYRSLERSAQVSLTVHQSNQYFIISVKDNGSGIDLTRNKDNIFKLYKRFHYHIEGKGLGLYLVKLQCEALGGFIDVDSEVNKSTLFTVHLKRPENIEKQILINESHASIYYDAKLNCTGVDWNGPVTSEQYQSVFNKCLEFLKVYNTPNWISNISNQGPVTEQDQHWMFKNILPEAVRNGLKRIVGIRNDINTPIVAEYIDGIKAAVAKLHVKQAYFSNIKDASDWIMQENENAAVQNDF